ncbi:thiosulfate reductase cytochrome B subunit [Thalassovita gelatinovora]|uniref:Thiosulfate reductase cytochrome B subunit n=1 Tax=Thalassovita gelatinovora TaxID=53501 RepID=A0A0P1F4V0_THAGE|nr:cytochrome b/b6 domain-containing protein [Thalassovita gelatinovora]QIZ79443.1 cytochrome B [Thalassovita gelatinovora]CUH62812.1 thiosulfate reductase cytochrome B subunit [Thalassovita gelatinovora]SEQ10587.1 Cytochrome b/b6/petB [Thalassovita gelatinovora]
MTNRCVKVYPRFERFWHWAQMVLIMVLLFTGLGLNGLHSVIPFGPAVMLHTMTALALLALWVFGAFWSFTTGTWRQFIPTTKGMIPVARFYAYGVFKGEEHPYQKIFWRKHNPLQAATYFALKWFIFPAIWVTGLAYLSYNFWGNGSDGARALWVISNLHLLTAYVIAAFIIVHVYLLTVGHGFRQHVKPMITGYDDIDLTPEQEAYLEKNEPGRLKPEC